MKFFGSKSVSSYLFYTTRFIAIGIAFFVSYVAYSFAIGNYELVNGRYRMAIPLIQTEIGGIYSTNIAVTICLGLFYYAIFFYLISRIFQTFKAEVLFTNMAIKRLSVFAILNLLISPALYILTHFFIMKQTNYRDIPNLILNILIGIFVIFVIAVFKHGIQVQSENDLTI